MVKPAKSSLQLVNLPKKEKTKWQTCIYLQDQVKSYLNLTLMSEP